MLFLRRDFLKLVQSIKNLSKFELVLWLCSVLTVTGAFLISGKFEIMTLVASLIGVTALIFVSKGDVTGQVLIVIFSLVYAVISFQQKYYGEIFTYVGMSAPIAALSVVTWLKNPYSENEVKVSKVSRKKFIALLIVTALVTALFYFILDFFNTASMLLSTISVTTSFLASALMLLRSPFYAAAYAMNDIVLVILWIIATMQDFSCMPMVVCFAVFLINDLYGLRNWLRMRKEQTFLINTLL